MYTGFIKIGTKSDVTDKDSFGTTFYKKNPDESDKARCSYCIQLAW